MNKSSLTIIALAACLITSGCVTGRRTVSLPVTPVTGPGATKGAIFVGAIEDHRGFQNKPSVASIPSIDGDVTKVAKAQLATMIGRQRNAYGKAMGDIALPDGDSVMQRMQALLEAGLKRHGYSISATATAANTATAKITEFWAWCTPGMWSVPFEANVACDFTLSHGGVTTDLMVRGHGRNQGQVASDANWQLAYQRAFDDFLADLNTQLDKAGL